MGASRPTGLPVSAPGAFRGDWGFVVDFRFWVSGVLGHLGFPFGFRVLGFRAFGFGLWGFGLASRSRVGASRVEGREVQRFGLEARVLARGLEFQGI